MIMMSFVDRCFLVGGVKYKNLFGNCCTVQSYDSVLSANAFRTDFSAWCL